MDISEVITEINNHGFTDTDSTQKMVVINDTLWDLEAVEPWPFLEKTVALNTDGVTPIPSNMPTDYKQAVYLADTVGGSGIMPERVETVRSRYTTDFLTATAPNPILWYMWGGVLRFYPIPPAATGRFYLDYIATQPELTENSLEAAILLPKRHHRAISLGALYKLYALEDDIQNAEAFQSMYEDKIARMREDLMRKQYQRADQVFLTDMDDLELNWP